MRLASTSLLMLLLLAPAWRALADGPAAPEVSALAPAPAPAPHLDDPTAFARVAFQAVRDGDWWAAASALLVLVVSLLRVYGRRLYDWIPDESPFDKPLWFLFDTKAGGYLLNVLTAVAGGVGTALLAGEPVTWALLKPIVMVSTTATALWEIAKDVWALARAKAVPPAEPPKP